MNAQSPTAKLGPLQYILVGIIAIAVIAGAVVTIVSPKTLSFQRYETAALPQLAIATGILGVGKGIHLGAQSLNLGSIFNTASSSVGQGIVGALRRGDIFGALSLFESAVPENLPSDHEELVRPAPLAPEPQTGPLPDVPAAPPAAPPARPPGDVPPAPPEPAPLSDTELEQFREPAPPAPLSDTELGQLRELQQRAAAAGQE